MTSSIHFFISFLIVSMLTILMFAIKKKFKSNFSTSSNVECGFNSLTEKNFKFSNQFFMIAIVFVIFDMELILIMPLPSIFLNMNNFIMLITIIILLIFSLLMEWLNGLIEWIKS